MPRGGDRRPLRHTLGPDLSYASLLMRAMRRDTSPEGKEFNFQREALLLRWERLVRVLAGYRMPGWGLRPLGMLDQYPKWLKALQTGFPVPYPRLTEAEELSLRRVDEVAEQSLNHLMDRIRWRLESGDENARTQWLEAIRAVWDAAGERKRMMHQGQRIRTSKRPMVGRYVDDVEDFCHRWRLEAWWAAPAIHQGHFLCMISGQDLPLGVYTQGTWSPPEHTIVVKLPGASDEEFERDRQRLSGVMQETIQEVAGAPVTVRWRPDRVEIVALEREHGASCVVVDWDGENKYFSSSKPGSFVSIAERVLEECQARLARPLTKRERRDLSKQIDPQVAEGRQRFLESGWDVDVGAALQEHAKWVASRLLHPRWSWARISGRDPDQLPSVVRSCQEFAKNASLTLPSNRSSPGRKPR